jgi:cbb3-type cytochrome oxidase subunit 3
MSKIVARILEEVPWLDELSGILTVFFLLMFVVLVIQVLRWKKEKVETYKNLPLSDDEPDNLK